MRVVLFPSDTMASVDGQVVFGVDYTGIDPTIHAVQWYDTVGSVEYIADPITGAKPQNLTITSLTEFSTYISQAEEMIYAMNNPLVVYAQYTGVVVDGSTYQVGDEILITTPNPSVPPGTTTIAPPAAPPSADPELELTSLFWDGSSFQYLYVDPTISLAEGQTAGLARMYEIAAYHINAAINASGVTYSPYEVAYSLANAASSSPVTQPADSPDAAAISAEIADIQQSRAACSASIISAISVSQINNLLQAFYTNP